MLFKKVNSVNTLPLPPVPLNALMHSLKKMHSTFSSVRIINLLALALLLPLRRHILQSQTTLLFKEKNSVEGKYNFFYSNVFTVITHSVTNLSTFNFIH